MTTPQTDGLPQVELFFDGISQDMGHLFRRFEFIATVNSGYTIKCALFDTDYHLLKQLLEGTKDKPGRYFGKSRSQPIEVKFRIKAGPGVTGPERATETRTAIITKMRACGDVSNQALIEFIGVDKASWRLNAGDGSGAVFKGRLSDVVKEVIGKYAPDITVDIGETTDNRENRWYMMRQDPQTFVASLLSWSAALTKNKTHWLIVTEDNKLTIKEQADFSSNQRAFYRFHDGAPSSLRNWEAIANNMLSITQTKIITQGISSISGRYLDRTTDKDEKIVFAKDSTTDKKQTPSVPTGRSFTKPKDDPKATFPDVGWTAIPAIPELSGGELGIDYADYIDSTARTAYLDLLKNLLQVKFRVFGHGEWTDCKGLGIDTIYVKWLGEDDPYWLTGSWLVYGFHHIVERKQWWTDLYVARQDTDSMSKKVGGSEPKN